MIPVKEILPYINAAGVPILAFSIFMLVKTYQKINQKYSENIDRERNENQKLREHVTHYESSFLSEIGRIQEVIKKADNVIKELQIKKAELLAQGQDKDKQVLFDVKYVNTIIEEVS